MDGDDILEGGDGDDLLDLGDGPRDGNGELDSFDLEDDEIYISEAYGGAGNDTIYGGSGHDQLYGGAGNDEIYAFTSYEINQDNLSAGNLSEEVYGGAGSDTIYIEDTDASGLVPEIDIDLSDREPVGVYTRENGDPERDVVVVRDNDQTIRIDYFDLTTSENPNGDVLDLSELRNSDGDPITQADVEFYRFGASGFDSRTYMSLTVDAGGDEPLRIRLHNVDLEDEVARYGDTLTDEFLMTALGIPRE